MSDNGGRVEIDDLLTQQAKMRLAAKQAKEVKKKKSVVKKKAVKKAE